MDKLITVIADYSDTQRRLVTHLVESNKNLELIASLDSADSLWESLKRISADLLILDIEMPGLFKDGLLDTLDGKTQLILITSEPQFALKAFDMGATDFLLKPVRAARFQKAIDKAIQKHQPKNLAKPAIPHIQIKCDHEFKRIALADILWIEAMGDYVKIVTPNERHLVLQTMKAMERALPGDRFLRIHRSYIVNLDKVKNYSSTSLEIDGKKLPMSRKRKPQLEEILLPQEPH